MNPQIKAKWIADLRSGKYQQTQEYLKRLTDNGPAYCCLGILCEVTLGYEFDSTPSDDGICTLTIDTPYGRESDDMLPPKTVQDEAGLTGQNPTITLDYDDMRKFMVDIQGVNIAYLNDMGKLSFSQIADIIEKYL